MTKTDRQRKLMEIISARRFETIPNLASELGVSRYTIMRDLNEITDISSIYTTCGKYGGGVHAVDGWYYSRTYYSQDQEDFLRSLLPGLQPEERKKLEDILLAFAKPRKGDKNGITQKIREGAVSV